MYKRIPCFLFITFLWLICGACANTTDMPNTYTTKEGKVSLDFPKGWKVDNKNDNFDLFVRSKDLTDITGVFVYEQQDLATDAALETIIFFQIEQLSASRDHFEALSEAEEYEVNGNTYITKAYSGEKDGFAYAYRITGIQFNESDTLALVLQTMAKSEYTDLEPVLKTITDSARLILN